ncbi:MAG: zinc ribbon domain-containing protein [Acutalibacteraceae bacterium]
MQCKHCGHTVEEGAVFCEACGTKLDEAACCRCCGSAVKEGAAFCPSCGNRLSPPPDSEKPSPAAPVTEKSGKKDWRFYLPIVPAIITVLLFFSDWLLLPGDNPYSLFDIFSKRQIISQIDSDFSALLTVAAVASFIAILLAGAFCILKLTDKSAATPVGIGACAVFLLIELSVFILTQQFNHTLDRDILSVTAPFYLAVIFTLLTGGAVLACSERKHIRPKGTLSAKELVTTGLEAVFLLVYVMLTQQCIAYGIDYYYMGYYMPEYISLIGGVAVIYHLFLFHPIVRRQLKQKSLYHAPFYALSILLNLPLILLLFWQLENKLYPLLLSISCIISALVYTVLSAVRLISCLHKKQRSIHVYRDFVFALIISVLFLTLNIIFYVFQYGIWLPVNSAWDALYYAVLLWDLLYIAKIICYGFRQKALYPLRLSEVILTAIYTIGIQAGFYFTDTAIRQYGFFFPRIILLLVLFILFFIVYFAVNQIRERKAALREQTP